MPSAETLERFVARVEQNAHAEAIEEFYAPDASIQENQTEPRRGRDNLVANERKFISRATGVQSRCIRPVLVNGDYVVIRWVFDFDWPDGGHTHMEELAYQRWQGERIVQETFFYDPVQRNPTQASA
jgi:hypothetical protein